MSKLFVCIYFIKFLFPIDLNIEITPDSIFVGSLVELILSVENLEVNKIPIFNDIDENPEEYTIVNKSLNSNSISYFIHFWNVGAVEIPPILIDIKNDKQEINNFKTNSIHLTILSNIQNSATELRPIKQMKRLNLVSSIQYSILLTLIILGLISGIYLWKTKSNLNQSENSLGTYKISTFNLSVKEIEQLPLPEPINIESIEKYYLKLSVICRKYFSDVFYIKATEMTSGEIEDHFKSIGIKPELINYWKGLSEVSDLAKFAKQIPPIDEITKNKNDYIALITSFNKQFS